MKTFTSTLATFAVLEHLGTGLQLESLNQLELDAQTQLDLGVEIDADPLLALNLKSHLQQNSMQNLSQISSYSDRYSARSMPMLSSGKKIVVDMMIPILKHIRSGWQRLNKLQ